jgi:hypothetical protein
MRSPGQVFRRWRDWSAVGLSALTAFGLLLALVAVMGPYEESASGPPAVRLMIGLPDWLKTTVVGLFALAALLLLVVLFPQGLRRRRKKGDDEFEMVYEGPKVSPWVLFALLAIALIPLGVAGYLLWVGWPAAEPGRGLASHLGLPPGPVRQPLPGSAVPAAQKPLFTSAVGLLGLVAGLGGVGLLLWLLFGDRFLGVWEGLSPHGRAAPQLIEAVEESLESLRQDADARRAIIRCYRRFEQVLAGIGLPRAPWETPAEFMCKALRRIQVSGRPVGVLTELFEVSRFSHHPLGPGERDTAVSALIEIKVALEQEVSDAHAV